jgi:hypothetical protein
MRSTNASAIRRAVAAVAVIAGTVGCGGHHLDEYRFSQRTLGLVWIEPPEPELRHGWYNVDVEGNAVQTVIQAGSKVAKEMEARKARTRLDSAIVNVDISGRLAQRTLERANRYLGTRMAAEGETPDYVLEVHLRSFGIDATSNNATYLFTRAETVLLDRRTGREIWSEKVRGSDRLTPFVVGTTSVPSAIFTAATLHTVSVAQFQEALEQLMTYTSSLISDQLREDLRDVRDK